MQARRAPIWSVIKHSPLLREWAELAAIYDLVGRSFELDEDDLRPPAPYHRTDANWKRNTRSVLLYRTRSGELEWDENARYRLNASNPAKRADVRGRGPAYWVLSADPTRYDIRRAVAERAEDLWMSKRSNLRLGDRVAIWKTKGDGEPRGVVALGEVVEEPVERHDESDPFWHNEADRANVALRARIRYVKSKALPLWDDGRQFQGWTVIGSSGRGSQGTVFKLREDQWDALLLAIGGWPESEEEAVLEVAFRPRRRATGRMMDPALKLAIEKHAVSIATAYYESLGWTVRDVGPTHSFDLLCRKLEDELHIEVKGTTNLVDSIGLTQNEVDHARLLYPKVELFVVEGIEIESREGRVVRGGVPRVFSPWRIGDGELLPTAYRYRLPMPEAESPD